MLTILLFAMNKVDRNKLLTQIFIKHYPYLCRYAKSYVHNNEEAKDVVSNVLLSMLDKPDKLSTMNEDEQRGYLSTSVRNRSFNSLKKTGRELERSVWDSFDEGTMTATYDDYKFEEEYQSYLKEAIAVLPPNYRKVVVLKYYEGLGYKEIAKEMNISVSQVGVILNRAKVKIKNYITEVKQNETER